MKMNNKKRYKAFIHSTFLYKLKNGKRFPYGKKFPYVSRDYVPLPKSIQEEIKNRMIEYQNVFMNIHSHTVGNSCRSIKSR